MANTPESKTPTGAVMVVGAGIAGVQAALDLANSGYFVYLVEKSPAIGGTMAQLDKTFPTNDCSMCILSPKLVECGRHLNIQLLTLAEVEGLTGEAGNFTVTVREKPRFIDMDKCIACGLCAEKCPKKVEDEFNAALIKRKAAYVKYPQAVPLKYLIDQDQCIFFIPDKKTGKTGRCRACEKFCPADAVNFDQTGKVHELQVGSVILAPGFKPPSTPSGPRPTAMRSFPMWSRALEFERILSASGPFRGASGAPLATTRHPKKIAWLQCVGSRDIQHGTHRYCSGVCCMYAIKEAVIAKEHAHEDLDTAIFFMDMRTYGKEFERITTGPERKQGCASSAPASTASSREPRIDGLEIRYVNEKGEMKDEVFDMVVLSVGMEEWRRPLRSWPNAWGWT